MPTYTAAFVGVAPKLSSSLFVFDGPGVLHGDSRNDPKCFDNPDEGAQ
jgi:hypothetical protein